MLKRCALWLRNGFVRGRSLNATRIVAASFAIIILVGALLLTGLLALPLLFAVRGFLLAFSIASFAAGHNCFSIVLVSGGVSSDR